jgi:hypothetical protein
VGGYGSSHRRQYCGTVEAHRFLALDSLRLGRHVDAGTHVDAWTRSLAVRMRRDVFVVELTSTSAPFGGWCLWFICPRCGRQCRHLYRHGESPACRTCSGLTYDARRQHRTLADVPRLERQREAIAGRLERARSPGRRARLEARLSSTSKRLSAHLEQIERQTAIVKQFLANLARAGRARAVPPL